MPHFSLVSVIVFLPLLGAVFLLFIRGDDRITAMNSRHVALLVSGCTFILSLAAWGAFSYSQGNVQFEIKSQWLPSLGISWHMGMDALSLIFVLLISFSSMIAIYASRKSILMMVREYMMLMLVLETFLLTAACARDFFQLFIFYEGAVIPLFILIAVWGVEKRVFSSFKFCFYQAAGSVLFFAALIYLYLQSGTSDIEKLSQLTLSSGVQHSLLAAFVIGFAFKAPLFPFHSWLTDAQTEAPVPVAIMLSGVFSKMIFLVFLRIAVPVVPDAFQAWIPYLGLWAVFSALYGALIAMAQTDMKKIAAYVQISQTGVLALGLFCWTLFSLKGMLFLCFSQSLSLSAYLLAAGALCERLQTRDARAFGGLISSMPVLGTVFFIFMLELLAFPLSPSFIGEFFIFGSVFAQSKLLAAAGLVSGVFLCAAFFPLFTRLMFGESSLPENVVLPDAGWREKAVFCIMAGILLYLALLPETPLKLAAAAAQPFFAGS